MANRFDTILAPDWMYTKFEKTPEGFLKGRAVICSTGIYEYRRADGSIVKELRLPEEVFAPAFLESLKLKPVTLGHPDEMVTVDNVQKYQKGTLGDNPSSPSGTPGSPSMEEGRRSGYQFYDTDMYHVSIDMIIHDADTILAVQGGTDELSVGYTCDLEPATPGARFLGQTYDYIQRNLRANHVAIVDAARCGDEAKIRLDSDDAILVDTSEHTNMNEGGNMPDLKVLKIDGVDYSAEARVLEELHTVTVKGDELQTKLDTLTTEKTQLQAKYDSEKDRADAAEAKVKELEAKKLDQTVIDAAVARKLRILDAARVAEVEVKDGMAEIDIQKAVIMKVFPKAVLDGKDAVYIDARFDGAVEASATEAEVTADAATRQLNGEEHGDEAVSATKAREKYIANMQNAHKADKK